ncbi:Clp protease N-terminal domain-containing protein [Arthrobacter sp. A2-55]|uniref:Clp protease N-terminal domain-containing protein n=1 Tax=Arthrobacter sp. A2-55 TaxID=2897337 RepID=UPI0021CD9AE2|nr:Clp protease N-terminal domain-containing protein [Arthrobacter sp. A2-55]MCU6480528.1 hypothetical protein [Arthrobacter sp. A2-55]
MFERYDDTARHIIVLAQDEARRLNHNYIGTEHVLLALARRPGGPQDVLHHFGLTHEGIVDAVVEEIGRGHTENSDHIPFTPRARELLMTALQEANELQDRPIQDLHLLLGLLGLEAGVGLKIILAETGNISLVREVVLKDMAISRAENARDVLTAGTRLHELLEGFVAAGGKADSLDFAKGQADAARQIAAVLSGTARAA